MKKKTKGGSARAAAVDTKQALGFRRVEHVPRTSYQDSSMAIIIPSRSPDARSEEGSTRKQIIDGDEQWPWLHHVFQAHLANLIYPMNQRRYMFTITGAEVGQAYDDQVAGILEHPEVGTCKYILTIEDDTLPPPDGVQKLVEAIEAGPFDGVGGLYFTKGDFNMPMCYGDPGEFARTGVLDFRPRDIVAALNHGQIMECNGIAMGFSLFRTQSFRDIPRPWFQTLNKWGEGAMTQDLFWCAKARRAGKRFAVDMRVSCAHADWKTNTYY